jgi:type IV pilus assembly protein PilF
VILVPWQRAGRGGGLAALGAAIALLGGCARTDGDPAKSAKRLDIARDALSRGDLDTATAESNRALSFMPGNADAYSIRGLVEVVRAAAVQRLIDVDDCLTGVDADALRKDLDEHLAAADQDFMKASKLAPDFGEAWANRGVVANLQGAHDDAVKLLGQALQFPSRLDNPALTRAHLGWAYFQLGEHVAASKELRQALQFQPGMCVATYRLGRVYFAREEWEKAAEQFQGVTDQSACGSQEASLYLMRTRIAQGLPEDAKKARDACIQLAPRSCIAAACRTEGANLP